MRGWDIALRTFSRITSKNFRPHRVKRNFFILKTIEEKNAHFHLLAKYLRFTAMNWGNIIKALLIRVEYDILDTLFYKFL